MSSLNNIDKKHNIVIYASLFILAIGLIYLMNKQDNLLNEQNKLSSLITIGPGSNTVEVPSTGGLYYYNPAICYLYATGLTTDGWIQWTSYNPTIEGFTLGNRGGRGANTSIIPNVYAYYEITINGGIKGNGVLGDIYLSLDNINADQEIDIWLNGSNTNGTSYNCNATVFATPCRTVDFSGFDFKLTGATLIPNGLPLFACVKYIGSSL